MGTNIEEILFDINKNLKKISKSLILKPLLDYKTQVNDQIKALVNSDTLVTVWNACDGTLNVTELSEKLGKTKGTLSVQIKPWIEAKIVFEINRNNSKYPITIDALINSIIISCID